MKKGGQPLHLLSQPPAAAAALRRSNSRGLLAKATAFLLVFSAGYILGILSPSSSSSQPQPAAQTPTPTQTQVVSIAASASGPPPEEPTVATEVPPPPHDLLRFRTSCAPPVPHSQVLSTVLDRAYNGTSPYTGFPNSDTAGRLLPAARHPRGWGSTAPVFADLIAAVRPRTIIELGTFLGASALHMAALTHNDSTLILCLDDFRGWPGFRARFRRDVPAPLHGDALLLHQFMLGVSAAGESSRVLPLPFATGSALAALCDWGVYGDLVEVDAGHDFHSAWADINMDWAVVRPGGVLFGHDYHTVADDRGVRRAVTLFAKVNGLAVRPHGQHWVLSPKPGSPATTPPPTIDSVSRLRFDH